MTKSEAKPAIAPVNGRRGRPKSKPARAGTGAAIQGGGQHHFLSQ